MKCGCPLFVGSQFHGDPRTSTGSGLRRSVLSLVAGRRVALACLADWLQCCDCTSCSAWTGSFFTPSLCLSCLRSCLPARPVCRSLQARATEGQAQLQSRCGRRRCLQGCVCACVRVCLSHCARAQRRHKLDAVRRADDGRTWRGGAGTGAWGGRGAGCRLMMRGSFALCKWRETFGLLALQWQMARGTGDRSDRVRNAASRLGWRVVD